MDKLISALKQLYCLEGQQWYSQKPGDHGEPTCAVDDQSVRAVVTDCLAGGQNVALGLISPDSMVRTMVASFEKACDWGDVAKLYQAIQEDLNLPAPAISTSGHGGYALWFSLKEAVPTSLAAAFLDALRRRYLAEMHPSSLALLPLITQPAGELSLVPLVPALDEITGKWSAFIDPSMGSMFVDEPGLEMAPNMGRQADMLARLESIKPAYFERALGILQAPGKTDSSEPDDRRGPEENTPSDQSASPSHNGASPAASKYHNDPRDFLLAVMNDPSVSTKQRIKAAKALLPYIQSTGPGQNDG